MNDMSESSYQIIARGRINLKHHQDPNIQKVLNEHAREIDIAWRHALETSGKMQKSTAISRNTSITLPGARARSCTLEFIPSA